MLTTTHVIPTRDGGLAACGHSEEHRHSFALKKDAHGSVVWTWRSSSTTPDAACGIVECFDNSFLVCGDATAYAGRRVAIVRRIAAGAETHAWTRDEEQDGSVYETIARTRHGVVCAGRARTDGRASRALVVQVPLDRTSLLRAHDEARYEFADFATAHVVRSSADGHVLVMLIGEPDRSSQLATIHADGTMTVLRVFEQGFALTSEPLADGYMLHGYEVRIARCATRVDASGDVVWTTQKEMTPTTCRFVGEVGARGCLRDLVHHAAPACPCPLTTRLISRTGSRRIATALAAVAGLWWWWRRR